MKSPERAPKTLACDLIKGHFPINEQQVTGLSGGFEKLHQLPEHVNGVGGGVFFSETVLSVPNSGLQCVRQSLLD